MKVVLSPPTTTTTTSFHQHHQQQQQHLLSSPFFASRKKRPRPRWRQLCMTASASAPSAATTIHRHHRSTKKDKIVVIIGATGTGKSRLSIELATRFFPSEILNSDKMQVYKGLDITTNKICPHDRRGVPHHFLGEFDEHSELSASEFRLLAESTVSDIVSRKRTPFLVGGSNSFVYSLLVQQYDTELNVFDASIGSDSVRRELRYDCCFLWVDSSLPVLYDYLDKRVDDMLDSGMFEELAEFFNAEELERDYSGNRVALRKAIGVPEFQRYFKKYPPGTTANSIKNKGWWDRVRRGAYEESVREIKENTRQLAKRQIGKIKKLNGAGWDLHRLDSTATFRLLLMNPEPEPHEWRSVWERQVLEPSVKIVKRFLEE